MKKENLLIQFTTLILCMPTIFAKGLDIPADALIWWRSFFGSLVGIGILIVIKKWKVSRSELKWLLITGLLMGAHWWSFFESIKLSTISLGILAVFTYPFFTVLFEPLIMKTKLKFQQLIAAGFIVAGMSLVVPEFSLDNDVTLGIVVGVFSAIVLGLRNVLINKKLQHLPALTIMGYNIFTTLLLLSIPVLLVNGQNFELLSVRDTFFLFILGTFFTVGSHALLVYCIKLKSAATMGILSSLQIVYATIISIVLFAERPDFKFYIGALIIVGVVIYEMMAKKKPRVVRL